MGMGGGGNIAIMENAGLRNYMQLDLQHASSEVTVKIQLNFHFALELRSSDLVSSLSLKFYFTCSTIRTTYLPF